jgi:hypothetical protein
MCPNLAKFLLGSDKIWLKFAIRIPRFLIIFGGRNFTPIGRGGGERTEEEARRFGVTDELRWFLMSSDPSSMSV